MQAVGMYRMRVTGSTKIVCLFGLFIEMSSRVRLNAYRPIAIGYIDFKTVNKLQC